MVHCIIRWYLQPLLLHTNTMQLQAITGHRFNQAQLAAVTRENIGEMF